MTLEQGEGEAKKRRCEIRLARKQDINYRKTTWKESKGLQTRLKEDGQDGYLIIYVCHRKGVFLLERGGMQHLYKRKVANSQEESLTKGLYWLG